MRLSMFISGPGCGVLFFLLGLMFFKVFIALFKELKFEKFRSNTHFFSLAISIQWDSSLLIKNANRIPGP